MLFNGHIYHDHGGVVSTVGKLFDLTNRHQASESKFRNYNDYYNVYLEIRRAKGFPYII